MDAGQKGRAHYPNAPLRTHEFCFVSELPETADKDNSPYPFNRRARKRDATPGSTSLATTKKKKRSRMNSSRLRSGENLLFQGCAQNQENRVGT